MRDFVGDPYEVTRLRHLMNPAKLIMSGVVENQDAYMKAMRERLSLQGNPDPTRDWAHHPKSEEVIDFISFALTEGRFARQADRLSNWRRLQELAGPLTEREELLAS